MTDAQRQAVADEVAGIFAPVWRSVEDLARELREATEESDQ